MKNLAILLVPLFFAALLFSACKKDEIPEPYVPEFPYFQMEVDGELWTPSGASFGGGAPFDVRYRPESEGFISLSALSIYQDLSNINLSTKGINAYEKIGINQHLIIKNRQFENECILFKLDTLDNHFIQIEELDVEARTIKVLFEFDCINECGDVNRIRNGVQHNYYGS